MFGTTMPTSGGEAVVDPAERRQTRGVEGHTADEFPYVPLPSHGGHSDDEGFNSERSYYESDVEAELRQRSPQEEAETRVLQPLQRTMLKLTAQIVVANIFLGLCLTGLNIFGAINAATKGHTPPDDPPGPAPIPPHPVPSPPPAQDSCSMLNEIVQKNNWAATYSYINKTDQGTIHFWSTVEVTTTQGEVLSATGSESHNKHEARESAAQAWLEKYNPGSDKPPGPAPIPPPPVPSPPPSQDSCSMLNEIVQKNNWAATYSYINKTDQGTIHFCSTVEVTTTQGEVLSATGSESHNKHEARESAAQAWLEKYNPGSDKPPGPAPIPPAPEPPAPAQDACSILNDIIQRHSWVVVYSYSTTTDKGTMYWLSTVEVKTDDEKLLSAKGSKFLNKHDAKESAAKTWLEMYKHSYEFL